MPKICCICGYKNSGKTTLVSALVRHLTDIGMSVGTIKHDGHDFDLDCAGTDSDIHKKAGARATALFSRHRWAFWSNGEPSVDKLLSLMDHVDIVLIEGLKDSPYPKIVMVTNGAGPLTAPNIIGIASDEKLLTDVSLFHRNDVEGLSRLILSL